MATLTEPQRTALEAAILAYLTAQGERLARTAAAFLVEAQLQKEKAVQTSVGGAVLQKAWAPPDETRLEEAVLGYLTAQGERYARTAAALAAETQHRGPGGMVPVSVGAALEGAWSFFMRRHFVPTTISSLFEVILRGNLDDIQLHVWMGTNVGAMRDRQYKCSPLCYVARYGRLEIVKYFVALGFDKEERNDKNGMTPFLHACHSGHVDVAKYLLDQGCDIDRPDDFGWTALHFISALVSLSVAKRLDVAELLFRRGATLNVRNDDDLTPTDFAEQDYPAEKKRCCSYGIKVAILTYHLTERKL